jgi:[ribosomal protein S18]-alanine N-acetyltransferase
MSAVLKTPLQNFRPMTDVDLSEILMIEQSAYTYPWSEVIFQDCLRVGYCCWVHEAGGMITAYAVMSVGAGECHILNLCVRPEFQNQGYGTCMLEHMLVLAHRHRADMAFLEVRPSNRPALKLYHRAGFDEVGMRRNYYPATIGREDAIILARSLI